MPDGFLVSKIDHRIGGVNGQRNPDHDKTHNLRPVKRFAEKKDGHEKHTAGGDILQNADRGQLQSPGTEVEKQKWQGRYQGRSHEQHIAEWILAKEKTRAVQV